MCHISLFSRFWNIYTSMVRFLRSEESGLKVTVIVYLPLYFSFDCELSHDIRCAWRSHRAPSHQHSEAFHIQDSCIRASRLHTIPAECVLCHLTHQRCHLCPKCSDVCPFISAESLKGHHPLKYSFQLNIRTKFLDGLD